MYTYVQWSKVKPRHFCFSHTALMKLLPLREAMKLELKCREQAPQAGGKCCRNHWPFPSCTGYSRRFQKVS